MKEELDWLHSSKCKYCGFELSYSSCSERLICKNCGRTNYKNKKIKFENLLKRNILKERRKMR